MRSVEGAKVQKFLQDVYEKEFVSEVGRLSENRQKSLSEFVFWLEHSSAQEMFKELGVELNEDRVYLLLTEGLQKECFVCEMALIAFLQDVCQDEFEDEPYRLCGATVEPEKAMYEWARDCEGQQMLEDLGISDAEEYKRVIQAYLLFLQRSAGMSWEDILIESTDGEFGIMGNDHLKVVVEERGWEEALEEIK